MKKYSESHEWVLVEGEVGTIGVSNHAQNELGEIVYVELPEVGRQVTAGEEAAVLESTKAAADVYSPVTGKIVAINDTLTDRSELVNESPEDRGWLFKVELTDPKEIEQLMDSDQC